MEKIVFGGGCFWCTEAIFKQLKGIELVESGYAGGHLYNPDYWSVAGRNSGHAEAVLVEYDPNVISFNDLLTVFFASHDPTTPDRQGADVGPVYRSMILYTSVEQRDQIERFIERLNNETELGSPIVTEVKKLEKFYPAEEKHQNFYTRNPNSGYCKVVINPKLAKVKERFAQLLGDN